MLYWLLYSNIVNKTANLQYTTLDIIIIQLKPMKILEEESRELRITKDYIIELDNGRKILVQKWVSESNYPQGFSNQDDADYTILDGEDPEAFEELSEEEQDKVREFINNIQIYSRLTDKEIEAIEGAIRKYEDIDDSYGLDVNRIEELKTLKLMV